MERLGWGWDGPPSERYNHSLDKFLSFFPNSSGHLCNKCNFASACWQTEAGCAVVQNSTLQPLLAAGDANAPNLIIGVGDEANLNVLPDTYNGVSNLTYSARVFERWAGRRGLPRHSVGCPGNFSWSACYNHTKSLLANDRLALFANPRLYYHFTIFTYDYGIDAYNQWTRSITDLLPNAKVGLNFAPGEDFTAVRPNRRLLAIGQSAHLIVAGVSAAGNPVHQGIPRRGEGRGSIQSTVRARPIQCAQCWCKKQKRVGCFVSGGARIGSGVGISTPLSPALSRPFLTRFPPLSRRCFALSGFLVPRDGENWRQFGRKNAEKQRWVSGVFWGQRCRSLHHS